MSTAGGRAGGNGGAGRTSEASYFIHGRISLQM